MKTAGIIAEYNPFHNGHKYQLDEVRKRTGADYIMVIMSGDFVQRGEPAVLDKYTRASMALSCGADLVLELPCLYAVSSAEMFARGGVRGLAATGCLDDLCFGAETDDTAYLSSIAHILAEEPADYKAILTSCLKSGDSFPSAREKALCGCLKALSSNTADCIHAVLNQPNNILAIEYLKQLYMISGHETHELYAVREIQPVLIPRIGDGYHDMEASGSYASATAIRRILQSSESSLEHESYACLVPGEVLFTMKQAEKEGRFLFPDSLSYPLAYRLESLNCGPESLSSSVSRKTSLLFADCGRELLNRILHSLTEYQSFDQYSGYIKNKSVTWSHVRRSLLHILLNYREDLHSFYIKEEVPYLRVLGFRRSSAGLLADLKRNSTVPIITRPSEEVRDLSEYALQAAELDLFASSFYNSLVRLQGGPSIKDDYSHPMVIL